MNYKRLFGLMCIVLVLVACEGDKNGLQGRGSIGNVILKGRAAGDIVAKTIDDTHTFSWDAVQLEPPSSDRGGAEHTLEFTPGFDRQELIAFDHDFGRRVTVAYHGEWNAD